MKKYVMSTLKINKIISEKVFDNLMEALAEVEDEIRWDVRKGLSDYYYRITEEDFVESEEVCEE